MPSFACGVCGCSTHTDWASQGLWTGPGFRLDLRYDYYNQNQLRTGTRTVDRGAITLPADRELQVQTINRNLTFGLDWSPTADWGLTLSVPMIHRTHETLAEGDTEVSDSRHIGVGDVRLVGRYLGFSEDRTFGVQLGVKLATGRRDEPFVSGPQMGEIVDRGLQAGTGTTDLILGLFKFGEVTPRWDYFLLAQMQVANGASDGFRPGNAFTFVAGVRATGSRTLMPQLQLNLRSEKPETGAQADTANSGSTLAYLSPGLTLKASSKLSFSAFVQVPVYQRVSGFQIEPKYLASISAHYTF